MFQVSQEREREREREGVSTRYDVGNTCEGLEKCGAGRSRLPEAKRTVERVLKTFCETDSHAPGYELGGDTHTEQTRVPSSQPIREQNYKSSSQ